MAQVKILTRYSSAIVVSATVRDEQGRFYDHVAAQFVTLNEADPIPASCVQALTEYRDSQIADQSLYAGYVDGPEGSIIEVVADGMSLGMQEIGGQTITSITLPAMTGSIYSSTVTVKKKLEIKRGDTPTLTFDLGQDFTDWVAQFGASDGAHFMGPKLATWTDASLGRGYVELNGADTAQVGRYTGEIQIQKGDKTLTPLEFEISVMPDIF